MSDEPSDDELEQMFNAAKMLDIETNAVSVFYSGPSSLEWFTKGFRVGVATHNTVSQMPSDDAIASMARQLGVKPEKVRSIYERASAGEVVEVHHYDIEKHAESFNEGYEAAMAQHLADDPSLAEDWLQEKVEAAFKAGAQWFIRIDFESDLSQEQRIERAWQTHLERLALLVPTSKPGDS